jgi:hypothetical protein
MRTWLLGAFAITLTASAAALRHGLPKWSVVLKRPSAVFPA